VARGRRVTFAAINIAMHAPHPMAKYVELLQKAFRRRSIIRMGALHAVMLGSMGRPQEHGRTVFVSGEVYRFVKLDPDQPWFNAEKKEPATDEDVEAIKIPGHLLPHLQGIPFVFNAARHRLWYVSRDGKSSLGTATATRFFSQLLQSTAIQHDLPEVSVTAVPESGSVEEILGLPGLEYLKIELVRPNPDSGESAEERWLRRLEEQKTTKAKLELFHAKNQVIEPDAETKEMAEVAANNGVVYGRGRTADGLPVEDSTVARPMLRHEFVDTDIETATDVLARLAAE
jgi:hypothetical protein